MNSDDNILEFTEILKPKPGGTTHYLFRYTKSITKLNTLLGLTEPEIEKSISNNLITVL